MADAKKVMQLTVATGDKPGMLAEVSSAVKSAGVNIDAICAYGEGGKAVFFILTNDSAKAKQALSSKSWQVKEDEVVVVGLGNKVGALSEISEKLKGINLLYCYGSACGCDCACNFILKAEDNDKALEALK